MLEKKILMLLPAASLIITNILSSTYRMKKKKERVVSLIQFNVNCMLNEYLLCWSIHLMLRKAFYFSLI